MDYFDDDDLINDYMEDDFEPPPEEEFPEEFLTESVVEQSEQTTLTDPIVPVRALPTSAEIASSEWLVDRNQATDPSVTSIVGGEINVLSISSRRRDDPYSFERYSNGSEWRQKRNEESFEVREWKRNKVASPGTSRCKSTASGPLLPGHFSQLLEPLNINITGENKECSHGVSKYPREGHRSVSMTVSGGTRVHVATCNEAATPRQFKQCEKASNHLLGVSMTTLMARSDTIAMKHGHGKRTARHHPMSSDTQLWVDKHAPSAFSHLLSDEQTNRNVLRALRAWDPYVFHREAPKSRFPLKDHGEGQPNTRDVRPLESHRVLLLSGPPGVGKTTLAHIIARHAGYQPLEVNASDDRSASVLQEKLIRAMESSTLTRDMQLGGKPNCIILDEVDGTDAQTAIAALVKIIRADLPEKGTKQKQTYLRRPIIFICNHKYAPTLRPLLPYCQHFDVEPPSDQRLVARLRAILAKERLSSNASSLLNKLVVGTGGDIRSCLFTLQFSAAKARSVGIQKGGVVDISSTLESALGGDGLKDVRTDLVSTVTMVFKKPRKDHDSRSGSGSSTHQVLSVVESFGDHTKTLECLFNNLLQVSYVDPTMERCLLAHEWISAGIDALSMSSAAAAAIHVLCRIETRADLSLSNRESANAHFHREANIGILQKFVDGLLQSSYNTAIMETVPYALWMLSAANSLYRPVSSIDILGKKELTAFHSHVSTLRSLGLTYVADERPNSFAKDEITPAVEMRLEPEIDRLVNFKGYRVSLENRRKRIPSVLRELLAHNARVDIICSRDINSTSGSQQASSKPHSESMSNEKQEAPDYGDSFAAPPLKKLKIEDVPKNFLGMAAQKVKASRNARKKALVGFNNRVRAEKLTHTGSGVPLTHVIRFKYQKGFTQAVRTVCQMEDLL